MSQDLKKDIKVNADTAVFMWVNISIIGSSYIKCSQKNIEELMQINRYRLKDYIKGQRAISRLFGLCYAMDGGHKG
jgi:hypothetical protein